MGVRLVARRAVYAGHRRVIPRLPAAYEKCFPLTTSGEYWLPWGRVQENRDGLGVEHLQRLLVDGMRQNIR